MSPKIAACIELEHAQLRQLLEEHQPLLLKVRVGVPDGIERSALAAMLHSLYTGMENLFKRIAIECDGGLPAGRIWHRALLDSMAKPTSARRAVFSEALQSRLAEYLQFRHVFRQAYSFQLRWEKMQSLVGGCETVLAELEAELRKWLGDSQNHAG
jgi:hypothetical protein